MNEVIKAIILGIVQGLSEFLPISSSGHLVLFEEMLNFHQNGLALEVFVHFGTLLAVLVVFRKDIWQMIRWLPGVPGFIARGLKIEEEADIYRGLSLFIVVGSIPAGIIGLLFKDQVEQLFASPMLVLFALFTTGVILWSSRYVEEHHPFMNLGHAILIGIAQAFAIIPGISRSGSTIVTGLWLGINRETSARFSFLLSTPVIFGATLLQLKDLLETPPPSNEITYLTAATVAAAISGYVAIIWLLDIVRRQKLEWFGIYCFAVSLIGGAVLYFA
ncbi:MAG: undecaprenyl-diphosphate phosphatase [Calditrichaeota bacterium]|nr:MAG: undecaprenyl-diphosphate phosphatase [Calditrichota bacterium]